MQAEVKDAYWALFDTEDLDTPPGPRLVELVDARITAMAAKYGAAYPAAMKCLLTDAEGLTAYLRFSAEHHRRARHSNFIERTFGETRRRTKVIGRLSGETSCLSLVWAVLDRASKGWRGVNTTADGLRLLHDLRRSLLEPPPSSAHEPPPPAQPRLSELPPNLAINREPHPPFTPDSGRHRSIRCPLQRVRYLPRAAPRLWGSAARHATS